MFTDSIPLEPKVWQQQMRGDARFTSGGTAAAANCVPDIAYLVPHRACCHAQQLLLYVREEVPTVHGETPASKPHQLNRKIAVESVTRPASDGNFIRMAKGCPRGYTQMIFLGPEFQFIFKWQDFKTCLCAKFRGTCTSV